MKGRQGRAGAVPQCALESKSSLTSFTQNSKGTALACSLGERRARAAGPCGRAVSQRPGGGARLLPAMAATRSATQGRPAATALSARCWLSCGGQMGMVSCTLSSCAPSAAPWYPMYPTRLRGAAPPSGAPRGVRAGGAGGRLRHQTGSCFATARCQRAGSCKASRPQTRQAITVSDFRPTRAGTPVSQPGGPHKCRRRGKVHGDGAPPRGARQPIKPNAMEKENTCRTCGAAMHTCSAPSYTKCSAGRRAARVSRLEQIR